MPPTARHMWKNVNCCSCVWSLFIQLRKQEKPSDPIDSNGCLFLKISCFQVRLVLQNSAFFMLGGVQQMTTIREPLKKKNLRTYNHFYINPNAYLISNHLLCIMYIISPISTFYIVSIIQIYIYILKTLIWIFNKIHYVRVYFINILEVLIDFDCLQPRYEMRNIA